jgi:peptidyl-prolyl cis-trans isomerase A (cyclophilin A)
MKAEKLLLEKLLLLLMLVVLQLLKQGAHAAAFEVPSTRSVFLKKASNAAAAVSVATTIFSPSYAKASAAAATVVPVAVTTGIEDATTLATSPLTQKQQLVKFTVGIGDSAAANVNSPNSFVIKIRPEWAPIGAARLEELIKESFFDNCRFFRVVPKFIVQFGINGDPVTMQSWKGKTLQDDPFVTTNARGTISFATSGKNSRKTQLFINTVDNWFLDKAGFTPVAEVIEGMEVVDKLFAAYGEGAPMGSGPNQSLIESEGNKYLASDFPRLDYIKSAKLVEEEGGIILPKLETASGV